MTTAESLEGLRTAYLLARSRVEEAESPIDAERWTQQQTNYARDIAELVATADLGLLLAPV